MEELRHKRNYIVQRGHTIAIAMCWLIVSLLSSCLYATETSGQTDNFDIEIAVEPSVTGEGESKSFFKKLWGDNLHFIYKQELSYITTEPSGVETNRLSIRFKWNRLISDHYNISFDGKSFAYLSNDHKAEAESSNTEFDNKLRELYVQGSYGKTSITIGKQVIVWGESETATVTDVFSPRNLSDFIFTSLDESRIGQMMLKIDQYSNIGLWTFLLNPDVQTDEEGFDDAQQDLDILPQAEYFVETEYGFRWKRSIGNGDFSFMAADLMDNQGILVFENNLSQRTVMQKEFRRYQLFGAAANINLGKTTLKLETAYKKNYFFQTDGPYSLENKGIAVRDIMQTALTLNINSNGTREWTFGISNQYIDGNVKNFILPEKSITDIQFGWADKFFHEAVNLSYVWQFQLETNNTVHHLSSHYSITDNLFLTLDGFILDIENVGYFRKLNQNSLQLRVEYNF